MTRTKISLGKWGEDQAAQYLARKGYKLLGRNLRTPYGEIDLLAWKPCPADEPGESLAVFVEVKARATRTYGMPEESVNARKRTHLLQSSEYYMQSHPELGNAWRIDVVAIQWYRPDQPPEVFHFENAVS